MSDIRKTDQRDKGSWPADIRVISKYILFFGLMLYVHWAVKTYAEFNGLFKIGDDRVIGGDFINYWTAGRLTLSHQVNLLFDIKGFREAQDSLINHHLSNNNNWSYPPFFLPAVAWLGWFSYPVALVFWLLATFASYAAALSLGRPSAKSVAAMLLLAPSTYANFDVGQNGFFSAALFVGGLRLLATRPVLAGILFGCLSYKPQLGLLIPVALCAAREWRVAFTAAATIIVLIGGSLMLYGTDPWSAYFTVTLPYQRITILQMDPSVLLTRLMPTPFMALRILGAPLSVAYAGSGITALIAAAAVAYAFSRCRTEELRNAVLLTATFLMSPYIFYYDMTLLSAAVISTILALRGRITASSLFLLFAAWFLPAVVFPLNKLGLPLAPVILLLLLAFQLRLVAAETRPVSNRGDRGGLH